MTLPQRLAVVKSFSIQVSSHPHFQLKSNPLNPPSSEEEDTLSVLPSALSPRPTESTDTPFLIELVKQDETKAVPTAAHTEKPSLPGFETESPSGQGKS